MTSSQVADWTIGDASGALARRLVSGYDALGVNVTWTGAGAARMDASFYKGMAFTTFQLTAMAPVLTTIHAITGVQQLALTVSSRGVGVGDGARAMKLARAMAGQPSLTQVSLNDGSQWLVVSKPPITWAQAGASTLGTAATGYTGFVQLAHMGDSPSANLA
ncbi:hypothetical protein EV175_007619, partial [Coemansia sp. RSA 1933]